jgi:aminoglycoside 3-N-acetyltransferase
MLPILNERKITPDELTKGFLEAGLEDGDSIMMHASLEKIGNVDGGAAMVIHRLLRVIGDNGTLLMPAFTSISRHSQSHDNFTLPNCWCEGKEDRHVPFIPELQPDKQLGLIAHRLCSWPRARRSKHPGYSYIVVGKNPDEVVRELKLDDPLLPVKKLLKYDPKVVLVGVNLTAATAIHLVRLEKSSKSGLNERALTISSRGLNWVEIVGLGCSNGFQKLANRLVKSESAMIGAAKAEVCSMKELVDAGRSMVNSDYDALDCDNPSCLSCSGLLNL